MDQLSEFVIQLITMKVSWGLPDEVKIELWLWCVGLFSIIGAVITFIKFTARKIRDIFQ
jgi:hypothetical protein